ncbi:aspartate aminotransferase family protein [Occultella glacieicola]|uniref:Aspartate aminotransferase family protein n=1 Tax=Occultella glacieicola TaxID=2518684 RepID=A0ABY2E7A5_9MICO|nr:aminotransferase class V-fold PLP-dependent enzyme [Occultella glacieicola]TDE97438.1 aspartate aminotransferase family protein [Occultella glacieicola]
MSDFAVDPSAILDELRALREHDAPTHGGRVLSYVYDPGLAELDELAADASRLMQPVNGLDPTTFGSVAALERDLVGFVRDLLHGDTDVVGTVTTGGTESCLLAVKTARDAWAAAGGTGTARLVLPATGHAAFRKAAHYFGLTLDVVPVSAEGVVAVADVEARLGPDVALVVVSAPSYPVAVLDPVSAVAEVAAARGIDVHVDACLGGLVLPFWPDLPAWDLAVPGVTSISADLHKYGYAPKGVSVLLQRGRDRQRLQYFATTSWPGYPVVNPTILGSRSAGPLAAAWAIRRALGISGFQTLVDSTRRSTGAIVETVAGIEGLRVLGNPVGPLLAVATDPTVPPPARVDPHHWADAVRNLGFVLQLQPANGAIGSTTHLTVTPVTERVLPDLLAALTTGADAVRGTPHADATPLLGQLPPSAGPLDSETAAAILAGFGIGAGGPLPDALAPLLAIIEATPPVLAERLLTELLARLVEPGAGYH